MTAVVICSGHGQGPRLVRDLKFTEAEADEAGIIFQADTH